MQTQSEEDVAKLFDRLGGQKPIIKVDFEWRGILPELLDQLFSIHRSDPCRQSVDLVTTQHFSLRKTPGTHRD